MSLILEALKKLEREKQGPERGVVVLASAALATGRASRPSAVVPIAVGLTVLLTGSVAWWALSRPAVPVAPLAATPGMAAEEAPAPIEVMAPAARSTTRSTPVTAVEPPHVAAPAPVVTKPEPATAVPEAALPAMRLSAISQRDGQPVAVVNDEIVGIGDRVGDAVVVAIGTTYIEVELGGKRHRISF